MYWLQVRTAVPFGEEAAIEDKFQRCTRNRLGSEDETMKILHIIPFLWNGAGKVLTDLCASQQEHHEVMIVTSGDSKGMSDWPVYRRRLSHHGILHRCVDFFDRDSAVY